MVRKIEKLQLATNSEHQKFIETLMMFCKGPAKLDTPALSHAN